ncbi:MAG: thymidylate kinase [Oscillospiraceae bacterium]|jgi:dTMP kinase|nr:thymidylate kinase [Oscillospiraceae bacterium]
MLVVLEGLDGSGKSTQTELLARWLSANGYDPLRIKLPHYEQPSSALVRQYLNGDFGRASSDVNAYAASMFYAVDRFAGFRTLWGEAYRRGRVVLADRYTTSNAYHQATKLPQSEWIAFFAWLEGLEYNKLGIPKPDLVLFLDMPTDVSKRLLSLRYGGDESLRDIHEADDAYLLACRQTALAAAETLGWYSIQCAQNNQPFSPEVIHESIRNIIAKHLAIR